jgi:DNA replication protein DnaC
MKRGVDVRYMLWREEIPALKALVNEPDEYQRRMDELAAVPVLYVDDFLKGTVTDADLNLVFALINARYNRAKARTVFSSELPLSEIRRYDEATGSRIWQRANGYILNAPANAKNWRTE